MNPPPTIRRTALPVVAVALLAGVVGAGGTVALWSTGEGASPAELTAGDLDIELLGTAEWLETSADVATAPRPIDPTDFLARPGDSVTLTQDFTTELQGDNLTGVLGVDWEETPSLPAGVSATYAVRDAGGAALATDVPVGTRAALDRLDADDDGRSDTFTIEVTIALAPDMDDRVGADAAPQVAELGDIVLTLDQTRSGEGFTS